LPNENPTAEEFSNLAEARSKIYGFLSMIHIRPPDNKFVQKIFDPSFHTFLTSLLLGKYIPKEIAEGVKDIEKFIGESENANVKGLCGKLSVEYTRLFRGVKRFYGPPPPYESVYVERGLVMGESSVKVSEEYAKAGVTIPNQHKGEPPDHIGFELDFMRHLCCKEAQAWKSNAFCHAIKSLEKQKKFIDEHLIKWVPNFCDEVLKEAKIEFYKGIAKITKSFVQFDFDNINTYIQIAKTLAEKSAILSSIGGSS